MEDLRIRLERTGDRDDVRDVVAAAFGGGAEAALVERIRASPHFLPELTLVAEIDGRVVGHVMVSHVTLSAGGSQRPIASLAPLAVDPEFHGRGIGSALVRAVVARAEDHGEPLIVLEGSPHYYGRFGFEHSVPLGIEIALPDWAPAEAAQVVLLRDYDPAIRGRVVYPPAFDGLTQH